MKRITTLFMTLLMCQLIFSQQPDSLKTIGKRNFILSAGYSHLRMLDEQVSPLIYRADIVPIGIGYQVLSKKMFWGINSELIPFVSLLSSVRHDKLIYNITSTNNNGEIENLEFIVKQTNFFQQEICVWYQRKIKNTQVFKSKLFVGGEFKHYLHLAYTPSAVFMLNEIGINPKITLIREINERSSFNASFSFPITGIMVSLPYSNDPADGEHGNAIATYFMGSIFFSPLSYQRVNLDFGYNMKLSKKWDIAITYKFNWSHYSKNRGKTAYENQIVVSFMKNLKNKQ